MKKLIAVAVAILLLPLAASAAAPTFTVTGSGIKIVCAATTCDAPTLVTEGLALQGGPSICAVSVMVETAGTMTAGGLLKVYVWNPESGDVNKWLSVPSQDQTVAALAKQGFDSVYVPVSTKDSRVTVVGSGVGLAHTIYINAQPCK